MENILYIVVPCYNEEEVLRETAQRLERKLSALTAAGKIGGKSRVLFVNDGSKDGTWPIIKELAGRENSVFTGVSLSRNRGHQNALFAGLMTALEYADATISIDADLQDDLDAMDAMIDMWRDGCDIVYGVRSSRKTDSFMKRATAEGYYKLLGALGCDVVFNHADFRLMNARALHALRQFGESALFLRGLVPMLGFQTGVVEYERLSRFAGESKYSLRKMVQLALDGVFSLSLKPIRLISAVGIGILALSALAFMVMLLRVFLDKPVEGWTLVLASVWAVGGLVLTAAGVLGEYVGRTLMEVKHRPRYIISETAGLK
ncbi:MAG TPA: glycosyltransferase family 2 protein [Papillibacter sp.]|jgi:glycosyltransferase involved in cell wall biosynthesis|nr:glycosyltransferase family 2 protein [Papillibacter sp.]